MTRRPIRTAALLGSAAALTLTACGGADDPGSAPATTAAAGQSAAPTAAETATETAAQPGASSKTAAPEPSGAANGTRPSDTLAPSDTTTQSDMTAQHTLTFIAMGDGGEAGRPIGCGDRLQVTEPFPVDVGLAELLPRWAR